MCSRREVCIPVDRAQRRLAYHLGSVDSDLNGNRAGTDANNWPESLGISLRIVITPFRVLTDGVEMPVHRTEAPMLFLIMVRMVGARVDMRPRGLNQHRGKSKCRDSGDDLAHVGPSVG